MTSLLLNPMIKSKSSSDSVYQQHMMQLIIPFPFINIPLFSPKTGVFRFHPTTLAAPSQCLLPSVLARMHRAQSSVHSSSLPTIALWWCGLISCLSSNGLQMYEYISGSNCLLNYDFVQLIQPLSLVSLQGTLNLCHWGTITPSAPGPCRSFTWKVFHRHAIITVLFFVLSKRSGSRVQPNS